jgi:hypothetical protein
LSRLEKFPQPGRQGFLNTCRATKLTVLLENLLKQAHKVKKTNEYLHI